jgi:cyclopropane-fatty-acyl-phospholipid synthase
MQAALDAILRRFVRYGRLTVQWPDQRLTTYAGAEDGPEAGMALTHRATVRRLLLNPALYFGEEYMDGRLVPLDCSIYELLDMIGISTIRRRGRSATSRIITT